MAEVDATVGGVRQVTGEHGGHREQREHPTRRRPTTPGSPPPSTGAADRDTYEGGRPTAPEPVEQLRQQLKRWHEHPPNLPIEPDVPGGAPAEPGPGRHRPEGAPAHPTLTAHGAAAYRGATPSASDPSAAHILDSVA